MKDAKSYNMKDAKRPDQTLFCVKKYFQERAGANGDLLLLVLVTSRYNYIFLRRKMYRRRIVLFIYALYGTLLSIDGLGLSYRDTTHRQPVLGQHQSLFYTATHHWAGSTGGRWAAI